MENALAKVANHQDEIASHWPHLNHSYSFVILLLVPRDTRHSLRGL